MSARPVVAIVPFAGRGDDARAGILGRQLARRLVEHDPQEDRVELKPVFLVTVPDTVDGSGHLIFGSAPTPDLAAQYGASLGATYTLTGTYDASAAKRTLDLALVSVRTRRVVARRALVVAPNALHTLEHEVSEWLVRAARAGDPRPETSPVVANEAAYVALLEAMEHEFSATLLRRGDPAGAGDELAQALDRYVAAARLDPAAALPEERLLVLAAEGLERGDALAQVRALEALVTLRPASWRAQYVLARLRAEHGDQAGAIVAFEHARSLHDLPDEDLVRLAELYASAGAAASARALLRGVAATSPAYGPGQALLAIIAFERGELEAGREAAARAVAAGASGWELHASYGAALHARGEVAEAVRRYEDAVAAGGPAAVRLHLARARLAAGDPARALGELDALLSAEPAGEVGARGRRLRFGLRQPELERALERAGAQALSGDAAALQEAADVFENAAAVEPALWEAHFGRGLVARQRGDAQAAIAAFRHALELWPDQPDALHELGVALLAANEADAGVRALDRAAALRPDDAAYTADAGFGHLRAGDLVAARQRLERAARLDATDPIIRSYLAELDRAESAAGGRR